MSRSFPRGDSATIFGALCFAMAGVLASCGGGGGGGGTPAPAVSTSQLSVSESLDALGVDTTPSRRRSQTDEELPDDFSPFGSCAEIDITHELAFQGLEDTGNDDPQYGIEVRRLNQSDPTNDQYTEEVLDRRPSPASRGSFPTRPLGFPLNDRSMASGDFDGDGLHEILTVYLVGDEVWLDVGEDEGQGFSVERYLLTSRGTIPEHVGVACGDFSGNGTAELAIGLSQGKTVDILFVIPDEDQGALVRGRYTRTIDVTHGAPDSMLRTELVAGNLDYDNAHELAVAITGYADRFGGYVGLAHYVVYDDWGTDLEVLASGELKDPEGNGTVQTADLDIGDIDGDRLNEVVIAGVVNIHANAFDVIHALYALDDAVHDMEVIGHKSFNYFRDIEYEGSVSYDHVNTIDIDGDGADEVLVNFYLFEDWSAGPWQWNKELSMPENSVLNSRVGHFGPGYTDMVTGYFTADDREDVAFYNGAEVQVYGYSQIEETRGLPPARKYRLARENDSLPALLPVNVRTDGAVLQYSEGRYEFTFTEPIVLAALAAPPCSSGIGQNLDGCSTAFGNTTSSGSTEERSMTVSASATAGVKVDAKILPFEAEFKATITAEATKFASQSYSLSKTVIFNSGPEEDLVVFSTVPLDQYFFTILSHPDPDLVGAEIVISIPRNLVTLQVEREFYNDHVPDGALIIDNQVLTHQVGDIASYPSRARADATLRRTGSKLFDGPVGVGQGTGSTQVILEVSEEFEDGQSFSLGMEVSVEVTSGAAIAGFSVGVSGSETMTITSGESTTYSGSVGAIQGDSFLDNAYAFGIYAYVEGVRVDGEIHEFQVVNYWVE